MGAGADFGAGAATLIAGAASVGGAILEGFVDSSDGGGVGVEIGAGAASAGVFKPSETN